MKSAGDKRKLPIAGRVFRSAIAVFALLCLTELALRLLNLPVGGLYSGDIGHYWTLSKGYSGEISHGESEFTVEISDIGIRDEGPPEEGPWVLALGCSTTFGWGVEADENWTEILESELGIPVVNGGVPGHSTAQGVVFAEDLLALKPDVVLFGWGVRDSQLAPVPDSSSRPSSAVSRLSIMRVLRNIVGSRGEVSRASSPELVARVSPEEFAQNLREVHRLASSNDVLVVDLAFPMMDYPAPYLTELEGLGGVFVAPQLPASSFFEFDPVHLNNDGHQRLAAELVLTITDLLGLRARVE